MTRTRLLCAVSHPVRGKHAGDCTGDCTGCLPTLAAEDLAVCEHHEQQVRDALRDLPGRWADLGDPMTSKCAGEAASGDSAPSPLADVLLDARHAIRLCLHQWIRILADDYAVTIPPDTIRAMAHVVAVHAGRLLASEHAEQLVKDLIGGWVDSALSDELVWVNGCATEAHRLTMPGPRAAVRVPCPACGARVRLDPGIEVIRCPTGGCDEWGTLDHWRKLLNVDGDAPRPIAELPAWLLARHGLDLTVKALRHLRDRGQIERAREHREDCEHAWAVAPPLVDAEAVCLGCVYPATFDPIGVALVLLGRRAA